MWPRARTLPHTPSPLQRLGCILVTLPRVSSQTQSPHLLTPLSFFHHTTTITHNYKYIHTQSLSLSLYIYIYRWSLI
ncbi:hypothetical protein QVD17_22828 [Tagetes erecta]|uniref:Uncharacterized protein n=1 Tax=Tagetes erecta TaxID=13708 RepID=A0AAD8KDR7_TARER|nr:hypothetical protein QVD17_22828 [Tagetes erecta]